MSSDPDIDIEFSETLVTVNVEFPGIKGEKGDPGTGEGSGDMSAATYDPSSVEGDAFSMGNMVETANSKVFTGSERTKLSGIEADAKDDQTGAEIKTLYEAEADTNAFTNSEKTKLGQLSALEVYGVNFDGGGSAILVNASTDRKHFSYAGQITGLHLLSFASDRSSTANASGGTFTISLYKTTYTDPTSNVLLGTISLTDGNHKNKAEALAYSFGVGDYLFAEVTAANSGVSLADLTIEITRS